MANEDGKELFKAFKNSDIMNTMDKMKRTRLKHANAMNSVKSISKHKKSAKENETKVRTVSHTEAGINWAAINNIAVPKLIKGGLTIGGGSVGSLMGAGFCTGVGFVLGGPGGAAVGYGIGNFLGFGAGAVGGNKFGKFVAEQLEDEDKKKFIEKGVTQINVDTVTWVDEKDRTDSDGNLE